MKVTTKFKVTVKMKVIAIKIAMTVKMTVMKVIEVAIMKLAVKG